jgi:hypothetical protein
MQNELIREYPNCGCPIGTTITLIEAACSWTQDIGKYTEFWEEVVQKDYEILTLTNSGGIQPNIPFDFIGNLYEDEINKGNIPDHLHIHSIKRKSDGEVFSIGDKVALKSSINYHLTAMKLTDDKLSIYVNGKVVPTKDNNSGGFGANLERLIKAKTPLFITEDSVEIFEGDGVHWVRIDTLKYLYKTEIVVNHKFILESGQYKIFSSEEKAKEFVVLKEPKYSLEDMVKIANHWAYIKNITPEKVLKVIIKDEKRE